MRIAIPNYKYLNKNSIIWINFGGQSIDPLLSTVFTFGNYIAGDFCKLKIFKEVT